MNRWSRDDLDAAARSLGRSGSGGYQHTVELGYLVGVHDVVAPDHALGSELGQILHQVVDEAVVVVDDEYPHGPQPTSCDSAPFSLAEQHGGQRNGHHAPTDQPGHHGPARALGHRRVQQEPAQRLHERRDRLVFGEALEEAG